MIVPMMGQKGMMKRSFPNDGTKRDDEESCSCPNDGTKGHDEEETGVRRKKSA